MSNEQFRQYPPTIDRPDLIVHHVPCIIYRLSFTTLKDHWGPCAVRRLLSSKTHHQLVVQLGAAGREQRAIMCPERQLTCFVSSM